MAINNVLHYFCSIVKESIKEVVKLVRYAQLCKIPMNCFQSNTDYKINTL